MAASAGGGAGGGGSRAAGQPREPQEVSIPQVPESDVAATEDVEPVVELGDVAPVPETSPYDPAPEREKIRGEIARVLVWALVLFLGFALLSSWIFMAPDNRQALVDVLQLIIGPLIGLVGAVTGFYFGERKG